MTERNLNPNTKGLILEGVSGSGKTKVLNALLRSREYLNRGHLSSIVLTEHHTQRVLEPKQETRGLTVQDNTALLRRHVETVRALDAGLRGTDWSDRGRLNHRLCYVLERFHLTHVSHYPHMRWEHVTAIDDALVGLGCKLCLLTADRDTIEERAVNRRHDREWQRHLSSLGSYPEVLNHYMAQQEHLLALREASSIPSLVVNTSEKQAHEIVTEVAAFWLKANS